MSNHSGTKPFFVLLLAAAVLIFAPQAAWCSDPVTEFPISDYWSIQFDNDFFVLAGDQHYTHGTEISRLVSGTGSEWFKNLAEWLPFYHLDEKESGVNYSLGQKIFTPEDLNQTALITDDRPYAGYLYFGTALISRYYKSEDLEIGNILELIVGIVGPDSGAATIQDYFHEIFDSEEPMGWDNQLKNEPGFGISYTRVWNIVQPGSGSLQLGMTPHTTMQLGNIYTHAAAGVMLRLGNNLSASFTPPNIRPGFPGVSYFAVSPKFSWYLFAGHESRIVFRDIFLDGNTFGGSHSVDKEILAGDHQFGFALHKGSLRLALSNMLRTKEFEGQDELTRYGALNLSFTF